MSEKYIIVFDRELGRQSNFIFSFGIKVEKGKKEKYIDIHCSRLAARKCGLIGPEEKEIDIRKKKLLAEYVLLRIKQAIDNGEIETSNSLIVDEEQFQRKDVSQELPAGWSGDALLTRETLYYGR